MDWHKFNNLSILMIDDDQFTRELITAMLKDIPNIKIDQAKDGIEALRFLEAQNYDLLLLDLYMPKMNGKEFIKSSKESKYFKNSAPIVLISTDRLNKSELKEIGANYYLAKPFDFQNFLKNIYGFLEKEVSL